MRSSKSCRNQRLTSYYLVQFYIKTFHANDNFFAIQITLNLANESIIIINNIDLKDFENHIATWPDHTAIQESHWAFPLKILIVMHPINLIFNNYYIILEGQKLKS